jgi:hypothetical protein
MSQTEVVSTPLQKAVQEQLDLDASVRAQLQPFIEKVGSLPVLITLFLELARAVRAEDEDMMDEQYGLLRTNQDLSPMFEKQNWNRGMVSATFIRMINQAEQEISSKEEASDLDIPKSA